MSRWICAREAADKIFSAYGFLSNSALSPRRARAVFLQTQFGQSRMFVRTAAERPMEFAHPFHDAHIIDAGLAPAHQTFIVEFPLLVPMRAIPIAAIVVPFVGEAHGDAIS